MLDRFDNELIAEIFDLTEEEIKIFYLLKKMKRTQEEIEDKLDKILKETNER